MPDDLQTELILPFYLIKIVRSQRYEMELVLFNHSLLCLIEHARFISLKLFVLSYFLAMTEWCNEFRLPVQAECPAAARPPAE